jgi:hypothetical protein
VSVHRFFIPVDLFRLATNTATTSAMFVIVTKRKVAPVKAMKSCRGVVV